MPEARLAGRTVNRGTSGAGRPPRVPRPRPVDVVPRGLLTAVVTLANAVGLTGIVILIAEVTPDDQVGTGRGTVLAAAGAYLLVAVPVLAVLGRRQDRAGRRWLGSRRDPTAAEATSALRLPSIAAFCTALLWCGAAVVAGAVAAVVLPDAWMGARIGLAGLLGGLVVAGLVHLLTTRITAAATARALAAHPVTTPRALGITGRLVLSWAMTCAVPLTGVALLVLAPRGSRVAGAVLLLVVASLSLGALVTALNARAVSRPLSRLRQAVARVERGEYGVRVRVDDAGEIGLLQAGVDRMAQGLAERERLRDLFGRHVGTAVAQRMMAGGHAMEGEERVVTALFIDITGSTALARRTGPRAMADLLNDFFRVVVDSVEAEGGLVNKFAGDGALCVFGAPLDHPDAAGAALRAARRISVAISDAGRVDVGIGISTGLVWAGPVGAPSRLEYTVIGDPVNEAARMSEAAKSEPGRVVASAPTALAAGNERQAWAPGNHLSIRGRKDEVAIWVRREIGPETAARE